MSEVTDQSAEIREMVAAAIGKRTLGIDYGFDVAWMPMQVPTPQGPRMMPVYTILITRRSPLLGQAPLSHLAQIPFARPTAEQVGEQVTEGLRLLAELFEQLKKPPAAPPAQNLRPLAAMNGGGRR
jgi:hypothetical protein